MAVAVKNKSVLKVPTEIQRQAGVSGGIIAMLPEAPTAGDGYTPEQRKLLDALLAEGLDDIRKGRVSRKFDTVDEMLASLKAAPSARPRQKKLRGRWSGNIPTVPKQTTPACKPAFKKLLTNKPANESENLWQARVNKSWRFFFTIVDDTYIVARSVPHPK